MVLAARVSQCVDAIVVREEGNAEGIAGFREIPKEELRVLIGFAGFGRAYHQSRVPASSRVGPLQLSVY